MRLLLAGAVLFFASRSANAACVITGAKPTSTLPTMRSPEFSFVASADCETLRFTIRDSAVAKIPRSGGPVGSGAHTYKVVLTKSEWDAVVAESGGTTLTWTVTGRTSAGVTTRIVTTNNLKRDTIAIDLSTADAKLVGGNSGDHAGTSARVAGDVNGDGKDDLFVGAVHSEGPTRDAGAAYLVLGPVTGTLDLSLANAILVGDTGKVPSVSGAGDVDDDGHDDLLIGFSVGAYLVNGPVTGTLNLSRADANFVGEDALDNAGFTVSGAGDADGDGNDDVLVGTGRGNVAYLVHGPVTGTFDLGLADAVLEVAAGFERNLIGTVVSAAGDVDGDGLDDQLIGAPYDVEAEYQAGAAYLVRGPVSGVVDLGLEHTKLLGDSVWDLTGTSVSGAGDIDGDGNDDVLIGAPSDKAVGPGEVYVVLGPGPMAGTDRSLEDVADAKLTAAAVDGVGQMVAGAGDVDLDGHDDILVGAASLFADGQVGAAYLVRGPVVGTFDLSGADIRFTGEENHDDAGWSGGAGDVDGDGRSDLLIGARFADDGAGAAYLIYGGGL